LGGEWLGEYGVARCPAHPDKKPSFTATVKAGKLLVHCHAGCPQKAVLAALCQLGLWPTAATPIVQDINQNASEHSSKITASQRQNMKVAQSIWASAFGVQGTKAENYLRYRHITTAAPASLRYEPNAYWGKTKSGFIIRCPAVIAAIETSEGVISAIHRVFLRNDGFGKTELPEPKKRTMGPMLDGAVRLGPPLEVIGLSEGWETGLSAQKLFQVSVWASLGANRMHLVVLPETTRRVIIFADNGEVGQEAAERTAQVHRDLGRDVEVRFPMVGKDFNDLLNHGG
jgi:putative DNA primase/helicase